MSHPEKPYVIVVGVDYSPASDLALEEAFELAGARHAEVHVVNVAQVYGNQALVDVAAEPGFSAVSMADAKAQLGAYVERQRLAYQARKAQIPGSSLLRVVAHLRLEAPAEQLAQTAADLDADLVVVGTQGRRGVARLLLGSVAEAVVRLAPCPVFVVREKAVPAAAPQIEPPCPRCVETRAATGGTEYWCEQHRERHGQRHTYHQSDRAGADTEMPLVSHN